MRFALAIKPASDEAKKNGCICRGPHHIDEKCPLHFPIKYIMRVDKLCDFVDNGKHYQPLTFVIVFLILMIEIFTRL
jgi:hypothetical protein